MKLLFFLNCRDNPRSQGTVHFSVERQEALDDFLQYRKSRPLELSLNSLLFVNNLNHDSSDIEILTKGTK